MSNDESIVEGLVGSTSQPDPVVPAKPARKPRTRVVKTDSAEIVIPEVSTNSDEAVSAKRARRRSGSRSSVPTPSNDTSTPEVVSEPPVEAPKQKPTRRRTSPKVILTEEAAEESPIPLESQMADVKPSPRRGRKPKEAAPAAQETDSKSETVVATEDDTSPSRRRPSRRQRGQKPPVDTDLQQQTVNVEVEERDEKDSLSDHENDPSSGPKRSRRRNSRSNRRQRDKQRQKEPIEEPEIEAETEQLVPVIVRPDVDISQGAHVLAKPGERPYLLIDGEKRPPLMFFGNLSESKTPATVANEIKLAATANVNIVSTLIELTCPIPPEDTVYETIDAFVNYILDANPNAKILPRIVFVPAQGWKRQYPNEVNKFADGTTDDPSIASNLFWEEAERALTSLVQHVSSMKYKSSVIGYHLERGEWFHPKDTGFDKSYANREGFRQWLRAKYKGNESSLRASWYDANVQFFTAEIPNAEQKSTPYLTFRDSRRDRQYLDFLEYTSDVVADRLVKLAAAIKVASEWQSLVSVCYGYTFEFRHMFSGHLAMEKVLDSPCIDIISGPPSYSDRLPGGCGSLPSPSNSCAVHGKLWISEDDTKTFLANNASGEDDFNPHVESRHWTEQVHNRAISRALAAQTGIAFMDIWGQGWLNSPEIWDGISEFSSKYAAQLQSPHVANPEVVVLLDEKSLIHLQRDEAFISELVNGSRETFQRLGASVGFYLQSDLKSERFPTEAKLYIFLNPYRLSPEERTAIREKLHSGKKTLVWMHAPGVCSPIGEPADFPTEAIGFTLKHQSWNSELGTRIVDARNPVTERIPARTLGKKERANPTFYVEAVNAPFQTLGEYQQTGLPSLVSKDFGSFVSVFVGEQIISAELARGLCKASGVHLFLEDCSDAVISGGGWLTIHASRDGHRILRLPQRSNLYDVTEARYIGSDIKEHKFFAKAKTTHVFYFGTSSDLELLDFPITDQVSRNRRHGRIHNRLVSSAQDGDPENEVMIEPSDEGMLEILLDPMESDEMVTSEIADDNDIAEDDESGDISPDSTETSQSPSSSMVRRRRRRGGRGRGKRNSRPGAPQSE